jgi:hypothetical protein
VELVSWREEDDRIERWTEERARMRETQEVLDMRPGADEWVEPSGMGPDGSEAGARAINQQRTESAQPAPRSTLLWADTQGGYYYYKTNPATGLVQGYRLWLPIKREIAKHWAQF